ncbi:hypothetical protein [Candidatus Methanoprimaticola sp. MG2]|uniref:hypothetical protein n=1 Tax=Candidatus Methanoprimaticola sp. MG2 TaxID=3228838 RepID=UPI0039C6397A
MPAEKFQVSRRTLVVLAVAVVSVSAFVGYLWDRNGGSLDFSDTDVMIVISGSMDGEPRTQYEISTIPLGSMVFVRDVPSDPAGKEGFYSSLRVGDVLTFDYEHPVSHETMVVTHRIIDISESGGTYTYTLKGDSIADDPTNGSVQVVTSQSGDVIGKVVGVSHWMGELVVFLSTWTGKACLILIPCAILIVSEVRSILRNARELREGSEDD